MHFVYTSAILKIQFKTAIKSRRVIQHDNPTPTGQIWKHISARWSICTDSRHVSAYRLIVGVRFFICDQ
ncbi:hypothetical protein LGAA44_100111 [Leuconostoc gasicomitatum]|nr:hypothetical protein LGAA44_100111 [Leuconostoc gasicomitatum]